jgi:hypothetical protein
MSAQLTIWDYEPPIPNLHFAGETYNAAFDCERLSEQQRRVWEAMKHGEWMTMEEVQRRIKEMTGIIDPTTSIQSRTRDFRNHKYLKGFFTSESRRRGDPKDGLFEYSVRMLS